MFKGLLYLAALIFFIMVVLGNTTAVLIFIGAILILSIGHAVIEKLDKKKKSE